MVLYLMWTNIFPTAFAFNAYDWNVMESPFRKSIRTSMQNQGGSRTSVTVISLINGIYGAILLICIIVPGTHYEF